MSFYFFGFERMVDTLDYDGLGNRLSDVRTGLNRLDSYGSTNNRLISLTENTSAFRSSLTTLQATR